jgi:hypothetical protein
VAAADRTGWLQVRVKDHWGNPATTYRGTVRFTVPDGVTGLPATYTFTAKDAGFHRFEGVRPVGPGVYRVQVRDEKLAEPDAESNPLAVVAASNTRAFWGDFHGQSGESIGVGNVDGHAQIDDASDIENDRHTIRELADQLRGGRAILFPHIGGRRGNLDFFDPTLMPGLEIYSSHGQFEWFLREAISRGLKAGFFADSDDHLCKPGDSGPSADHFYVHGGLTCIYARELTREALWEAIEKRHFYATSGERIGLHVGAGSHEMGDEMPAEGPVEFSVEVNGTAGIERVDLFRGLERVYRHPGGRIRGARGYAFDYPSEGILSSSADRVSWESRTAGDEDGVILDVEEAANASLSFETKPARFSVPLSRITGEDWVYEAGGLDRRVVLRRVAAQYGREVRFRWTDKRVPSGTTAYWVRVLQQDGAVAWSTPIFVTRR